MFSKLLYIRYTGIAVIDSEQNPFAYFLYILVQHLPTLPEESGGHDNIYIIPSQDKHSHQTQNPLESNLESNLPGNPYLPT